MSPAACLQFSVLSLVHCITKITKMANNLRSRQVFWSYVVLGHVFSFLTWAWTTTSAARWTVLQIPFLADHGKMEKHSRAEMASVWQAFWLYSRWSFSGISASLQMVLSACFVCSLNSFFFSFNWALSVIHSKCVKLVLGFFSPWLSSPSSRDYFLLLLADLM